MDRSRGGWAFAALVWGCWGYALLPRLVQTATAPKFRTSVGAEQASLTPLAQLVQLGALLGVLALCAFVLVTHLRRVPTDGAAVLLLSAALFAFGTWRDVVAGAVLSRNDLLIPSVVLAVWLLRPRRRDLAVLGWVVLTSALLNAAVGALVPGGLFRHEDGGLIAPEKQILPGGILVGVFAQGNNLGQLLSLGAPAVAFLPRRWRAPAVVAVVGVVLWSASRSSLLAIAAAGAVFLLVSRGGPLWRGAAALAALVGLGSVLVLLPLLTTDPTAFSNRGYIWAVSLDAWRQEPLIGWGSGYYTAIGRYVNPLGGTAWHGHNSVVQLLVTGGLVQVGLVAVLAALLLHRCTAAAAAGWSWPAAQVAALFVSGTLEFSFGVVDRQILMTSVLVPLVAILVSRPDDPGGAPGASRPPAPSNAEPGASPEPTAPDLVGAR